MQHRAAACRRFERQKTQKKTMSDLQIIGGGKAVLNYDGTRRVNTDGKFTIAENDCCEETPNVWFAVYRGVFYTYMLPPVAGIYAMTHGSAFIYINDQCLGESNFDYSGDFKDTRQLVYIYHKFLTDDTFTTLIGTESTGDASYEAQTGIVFAKKNNQWAVYRMPYYFGQNCHWELKNFDYKFSNVNFYDVFDRPKIIANQRFYDVFLDGNLYTQGFDIAPFHIDT
jgi:hypothetical protein